MGWERALLWGIESLAVGLVVGSIVRFLFPRREGSLPFWLAVLVSVCGALLAGVAGRLSQAFEPGAPLGFTAALLGSLAFVFFFRMLWEQQHQRRA